MTHMMGYTAEHGHAGQHCNCPHCTCQCCGHGRAGKGSKHFDKWLIKKAWKHSLVHKIKDELEKRHDDKLNEIAKEMVDIADEKMKMKAEIWKKKKGLKETFWSIFEEEGE